jgi:hypothetical protein
MLMNQNHQVHNNNNNNNHQHVQKQHYHKYYHLNELNQTTLIEDRAFLIHNFLSKEECAYYINNIETLGLEDLTYGKHYRNNTRCIALSNEISEYLWERLKPFIKPITVLPNDYKQIGKGYKLEGTWDPIGLNPCWRFCKYTPGGHFGPHYDGPYIINDNERSLQTLNLYLNSDFNGGSTNFVNENQSRLPGNNGKYYADEKNILLKIVPHTGLALIFNHHMLHEGQALESNVKYLMRSDVLFRRRDPPVLDPQEI